MQRYSSLAIYLHWLSAIVIIVLLLSGWSLYFEVWQFKQLVFELYQWHKSIGVVVLIIVAIRICWRFKRPPPKLPHALDTHRKKIHAGHAILYVLMIVMPLSGWVLVSTNPQGIPTIVFGIFEWLHLPLPEAVYKPATLLHFYAAIVLSIAIVGHILLSIKHQIGGVAIFARIFPQLKVSIAIVLTVSLFAYLSMFVFQTFDSNTSEAVQKNQLTTQDEQVFVSKSIAFHGEHAGNPFTGTFEQWQLDTDIDFANQTMTRFDLNVLIDSVKTGSSLNDKTLMERDWFHVEEFPSAIFRASSVEFLNNNQAMIIGQFTVKNIDKSLKFLLTLNKKNITTEFILKRSDFELGQEADPDAEWVSEEIKIEAQLVLKD